MAAATQGTTEGLDLYLSALDITKALGICRSGLFSLIKRGLFPQGVKIGRSRRWALSEIKEYLEWGLTHE